MVRQPGRVGVSPTGRGRDHRGRARAGMGKGRGGDVGGVFAPREGVALHAGGTWDPGPENFLVS